MPNLERFSISDPAVTPDDFVFGDCFAFGKTDALARAGYGWLTRSLKETVNNWQIIPLVGTHPINMFGLTITPQRWLQIDLSSIVSDKSLYRADNNLVHLLVVDPLAANTSQTVQILLNGNSFSRQPVRMGENGEAQLVLRDLPVGEFEVSCEGREKSSCKFTVAEYRLVPLVVSVQTSEMKDDKLSVTLRVESFGTAVNGKLKIDLMENYHKIETVKTKAEAGIAKASFKLTGAGPHSLNVQLEDEPSKTASVPLRGSREEERSKTIFSRLGNEVHGSLLAEEGSQSTRGLHLVEGGLRTSPITLARVNDSTARLKMNKKVDALKVVVIDPTFPKARADAQDPATASHPQTIDARYRDGERLFKSGRADTALQVFLLARENEANPHPYYAYWIACCEAKLGKKDAAVQYLRKAIEDGWVDFHHMENDEDLTSLRGYAPYEELKSGGIRELTFDSMEAGHEVQIEVYDPISVILLGAFIEGQPWEGWATVITPSTVSLKLETKEEYRAGEEIHLQFKVENAKSNRSNSSLYVVLKDARLLSTDTPESQLAARLKSYVEASTRSLSIGRPTEKLSEIYKKLEDQQLVRRRGSFEGASTGGWGSAPAGMPMMMAQAPMSQPAPAPTAGGSNAWGGLRETFGAVGESLRSLSGVAGTTRSAYRNINYEPAQIDEFILDGSKVAAAVNKSVQAPSVTPIISEEPEVLFAGFIKLENGKGELKLQLPDYFNDYIVECFTLSGLHWHYKESRFKAAKDPFVHLTLPVFAKEDEETSGTLQVSSLNASVSVTLFKDGKEVALKNGKNNLKAGEKVNGSIALQFNAGPGEYEAIIKSDGKVLDRVVKQVQEPGKLKRRVRTMQLLQAGESIGITGDTSIKALSLMPGLENSFNLLVDATADYGHSCCEQTAAKLMAGCAMYALANGDAKRRSDAEAVILAGIRREQSMWLKGRGFKTYPEVADQPNPHYGPMAARYLWNLELLRTTSGGDFSPALARAVEQGIEMAQDTTRAYNLTWPPKQINSAADAYHAVRYGEDGDHKKAIEFAKKQTAKQNEQVYDPYFGRNVHARMENAYAAAALLHAGGPESLKTAINLANAVVGQFNEQGRLYSTADSVAAIALMSELKAAGVTGGSGNVELNERSFKLADAIASTEEIKTVKVLDGVAMVAVDRIVEEDWSNYGSDIEMTVKLNKNGRHQSNLVAGDSVDLTVKLDSGYKDGDLLWVCLPDALSRVVGGGQVKLFSIDFVGKDEVTIPLAATGITGGAGKKSQSMAVCVRNMFIEERAGSPGLIAISVKES